jgi:glycosyltransferase involved in cell wall biosynthesis
MTNWTDLLEAPAPAGTVAAQRPPTLSVLVPAYNAATTIGEALESALTQRPAPLEVIVSDDGSEDDLDRVLAGFGDRVRVVRGPNGGLATARNRAAAVAEGELLGLLDADDVWLPGRAAALTEAAGARPDLGILTTDAVVVRDGRPDADTYYDIRTFETEDQETAILRSNFVFGAGAVRATALAAAGGYDPAARWAEDWDLWLRMLLSGHRAGLVRAPLYEYRRRGGSLTDRKVDLALGVQALLDRAEALVPDPARRRVLDRTRREWAVAAVRSARASADPRRHRLALAAVRAGGHPARAWARLVVDGFLRPTGPRR